MGRILAPSGLNRGGHINRNALGASSRVFAKSFCYLGLGQTTVDAYEALPPSLAAVFSGFSEFENGVQLEREDAKVNLPVLVFGEARGATQELSAWCETIARALSVHSVNLDRISAAFMWRHGRYWIILSLCDEPLALAAALERLPSIARTDEAPSARIEDFKAYLETRNDGSIASMRDISWPGLLRLQHDQSSVSFRVPSEHPAFESLRKAAEAGTLDTVDPES